jgi:dimethylhistidine N-methyltransferase
MTGLAPRFEREPARSASSTLRQQVLRGLRGSVKTLSPALFYDATGARLFEQICELPEYYPTRTEQAILARYAGELADHAGPSCALIEYGSGAGVKVRYLLDRLDHPVAYVPVDISREQLHEVARERAAQYPGLRILPVCADYTTPFDLPSLPPAARRVAFFPGSTIGNFHPAEAAAFLHRVRHTVGGKGGLILGVDRRKVPNVLHAAYNDAAGVTAEFNLNLLTRLNREFGADFDLRNFRHRAFFDDATSRVEMHLEACVAHQVRVDGVTIDFAVGETIHTECSYKYDRPRLEELVEASGFRIETLYTDERDWFWEAWLVPTP